MPAPFVSVIIPAFNMEAYVRQALESLVAQTFRGYEAIIVDDGSTDGTCRCVEPFLADPRFRLIRQENKGLPGARNTGILAAKGDWLGFLDADDEWYPDKLDRQVKLINETPNAALVFGNGMEFDEHGDVGPFYHDRRKFPQGDILRRLVQGNCFWVCSVMVRRLDAIDVGLFKPGGAEDFDMWLRILQRGGVAVGTWEQVARYRKRGDSLSADRPRTLNTLLRIYQEAHDRSANGDHKRLLAESVARTRSDLLMTQARALVDGISSDARKARGILLQAWREFPSRTKPFWLAMGLSLGRRSSVVRALARKW